MELINKWFIQIDIILLLILLIILVRLFKHRTSSSHRYTAGFVSVLIAMVGFNVAAIHGTVVDELNAGGNPLLFFLSIAVLGLSTVNVITALLLQPMKKAPYASKET